jgi:hypothetical protein
MNITIVEIRAQQRYRTILLGSLYNVDTGRLVPVEGFRRMGRDDEYDPEVSREEAGEDGYEE